VPWDCWRMYLVRTIIPGMDRNSIQASRHPCRPAPADFREPDGRDGHPCQGGCESYKQETVKL